MSRIALGLMRISEMSVDEVERLILGAIEKGITIFDLADIYGRTKNEKLFGEVLKKNPDIREKIYLQTKVGIIPGFGYDLSYDYIKKAVNASLERLNTTYLDSLLLHRPDVLMESSEVAKAINELVLEGKIKDFGVSNFTESEIEYLKSSLNVPIKYNQVQVGLGNTTMIDQVMYTNIPAKLVSKESDSLLFYLKKENITIQAWSPFQMGFFEGSIFNEKKYPEINKVLDEYAKKYNTTKCAIATAFLLKLDKNLIVVTGSTNLYHIEESILGEYVDMIKADWYQLYAKCGHMLP